MEVGVMVDDDWEEVGEKPNLTVVESNNNTTVAFYSRSLILDNDFFDD